MACTHAYCQRKLAQGIGSMARQLPLSVTEFRGMFLHMMSTFYGQLGATDT
jgi:hypothetical protein